MSDINEEIKTALAKAFFACAWANAVEDAFENGIDAPNLFGQDIMQVMPEETDKGALDAADKLAIAICQVNNITDLENLFDFAERMQRIPVRKFSGSGLGLFDTGDRELTPELFGHYCAMQAMGTGVGLESFGDSVRDRIKVPYMEFSQCDLQKDYFPSQSNSQEQSTEDQSNSQEQSTEDQSNG
jgi:hypothetical protein